MIDVGGPSMLRAAAKNFAHVAVVSSPAQYDDVLAELREHGDSRLETRRRLAREAFATTAAYEAAIANWFGEDRAFPGAADAGVPQGHRPLVRREPAPGGGVLPRARRAPASALAGSSSSAARSSRTTTSPISREPGGSPASSTLPARRDRQAREPVRRRGRRDDRRGLGARARRRSGLGVRLRRRAEPAGRRRARGADRRALRRGAARPGIRRRPRSTRCARGRRSASSSSASRRPRPADERDYKRVLGGAARPGARQRSTRSARRCRS